MKIIIIITTKKMPINHPPLFIKSIEKADSGLPLIHVEREFTIIDLNFFSGVFAN